MWGNIGGIRIILYLDCGRVYVILYTCQNTYNCKTATTITTKNGGCHPTISSLLSPSPPAMNELVLPMRWPSPYAHYLLWLIRECDSALFKIWRKLYLSIVFFMIVDIFHEILTYASPAVLSESVSHSALRPMDYSLPGSSLHEILPARILEEVATAFSKGIFPIQGLNPGLLHCRQILYHLSFWGSLAYLKTVNIFWCVFYQKRLCFLLFHLYLKST